MNIVLQITKMGHKNQRYFVLIVKDYVIGDASGFPVTNKEFLQYMWECNSNNHSLSSFSENVINSNT